MRTTRQRKLTTAKERVLHYILVRRLRHTDHTKTLPDEILIHIFSYLTHEELYFSARAVCKRWSTLVPTPSLWRSITGHSGISTNMLCNWIEHAPLLKAIRLYHRRDMNIIVQTLAIHSPNLEYFIAKNCCGTSRSSVIRGNFLCRLIRKCPKLKHFGFVECCIRSSKFYAMLKQRLCHYFNINGGGKLNGTRIIFITT
ncbi:hypothetical protein HUJ04_009087 [Dendroctonus ponderosae]|nr:hypothetical protein HUJ04_009087 [Dendroctonus ponderosae]KAH1026443.1 hypothetical protein HUJ05_000113 [Dendroctonus ponderosae]